MTTEKGKEKKLPRLLNSLKIRKPSHFRSKSVRPKYPIKVSIFEVTCLSMQKIRKDPKMLLMQKEAVKRRMLAG